MVRPTVIIITKGAASASHVLDSAVAEDLEGGRIWRSVIGIRIERHPIIARKMETICAMNVRAATALMFIVNIEPPV